MRSIGLKIGDLFGGGDLLTSLDNRLKQITDSVIDVNDVLGETKTTGSETFATIGDMAVDSLGAVGKRFLEMQKTGEVSWKALRESAYGSLSSIVEYLAQSGLDYLFGTSGTSSSSSGGGQSGSLTSGIGDFLSGALSWATDWLFSANGNAFGPGGMVEAYAMGGVIAKPTMFRHAQGLGLMGEAGPEAIMPLRRLGNGSLGVQASGASASNVTVNVHDNRTQGASQPVEVSQSTGPNGEQVIDVMVREAVNKHMRKGTFDKTMTDTYGVRRTGVRR